MSTSISKNLIHQKCKRILSDLDRLREMLDTYSYDQLIDEGDHQALAERFLERIVTRAIDVNFHLIRASKMRSPDDYTESFRLLAQLNILSPEVTSAIAPSAGARNILVHAYDDLDPAKLYSSFQDAVRLFPKYVREIERYIEKKNGRAKR